MSTNDVLRRLRYIFNIPDSEMVSIFSLVDSVVEPAVVASWLKKEDDPAFASCPDVLLATFLNGLIVSRRGKKEGPPPVPETKVNNNIILRKLKIALNYKSEDMLGIYALTNTNISAHELSAFFRKKGNKHRRECKDQFLRRFLQGLTIKYRPQTG